MTRDRDALLGIPGDPMEDIGQSKPRLDGKRAAMANIRKVEEALRRWDPIGVKPGTMAPADEYDSYAPHIVSMVQSGCTVEELAAHLDELSSTTIGLGSNPKASATFAAQIVKVLTPSARSPTSRTSTGSSR